MFFLVKAPCWNSKRGASQREGGGGVEREEKMPACFFFSPPPFPFPSFSLAPTPLYLKGCYFYSPQCSSVIKSKMAAKTIRTQTSFRPPKIHLQCRLLFYGLFKSVLQRCWLNLGIFPNFHFPSQWLRFFLMLALQPSWKIALLYKLIINYYCCYKHICSKYFNNYFACNIFLVTNCFLHYYNFFFYF